MEIKRVNAIRSYERVTVSAPAKKDAPKAANTDKVDFDFAGALAAAKANAASGADAEANVSKIQELQAQYQGDSCPVSSELIARAILGQ